jgi:hypothetical protein
MFLDQIAMARCFADFLTGRFSRLGKVAFGAVFRKFRAVRGTDGSHRAPPNSGGQVVTGGPGAKFRRPSNQRRPGQTLPAGLMSLPGDCTIHKTKEPRDTQRGFDEGRIGAGG